MWGQIASAGIGALGGALGGGGGDKVRPMDAIPDFLKDDYKGLAGQVAGLDTPMYYQGQQIADMNPWMSGALSGMGGWGSGMGGDMMSPLYGGGLMGLGAMQSGLDLMGQNQGFQYDQGTYDQAFSNLTGGMQNAFDLGAQQMQQNFDWNMHCLF